jgi:hypothetical protein
MVLPGVEDVIANLDLLVSILISDDLPTLLRPMNAYSGRSVLGHISALGEEPLYSAEIIFIIGAPSLPPRGEVTVRGD